MRPLLPICLLVLACSFGAQADVPIQNPPPPHTPDLRPSRPVRLTGTLMQRRTSGTALAWVLNKPERDFNLDISLVRAQAQALRGQRVVIRGLFTTDSIGGLTPYQVVRVSSIERAP